jgi:predicted acetyltransferase
LNWGLFILGGYEGGVNTLPKQYDSSEFSLVLPNLEHETEYCRIMALWETYIEKIQPPSMRRYSEKENFIFSKWLKDIEDDRTTGSMLENHIPCTLYFLVNGSDEILGGISFSHANTYRGQLHAGIVPWYRGKGYGTVMLSLALTRCKEMGMDSVQIAPRKDNNGAIQTILRNGGVLAEDFLDGNIVCLRYNISL